MSLNIKKKSFGFQLINFSVSFFKSLLFIINLKTHGTTVRMEFSSFHNPITTFTLTCISTTKLSRQFLVKKD